MNRTNNNRRRNNNNNVRRRPNRRQQYAARRPNTARGISGEDNVIQTVTFRYLETLVLDQSATSFDFGVKLINFQPLGQYTKNWFEAKAAGYDRYRVCNINIKATPGANLDISKRAQVNMFSRYDPTYNELPNDLSATTEIMFATNTRQQNFGASGKVLLISGTPKLKRTSGSTSNAPLLPTNLQWYNTSDLFNTNLQNRWNLGTAFATVPRDDSTNVTITLIVCATVQFKSRKGPVSGDLVSFTNDHNSVTYDLETTEDELRTRLLDGTYFPIDLKGISIGNIGSSVTGDQLLGIQIRQQSDMSIFELAFTSSPSLFYTLV